jgi:hypothetical protein
MVPPPNKINALSDTTLKLSDFPSLHNFFPVGTNRSLVVLTSLILNKE